MSTLSSGELKSKTNFSTEQITERRQNKLESDESAISLDLNLTKFCTLG